MEDSEFTTEIPEKPDLGLMGGISSFWSNLFPASAFMPEAMGGPVASSGPVQGGDAPKAPGESSGFLGGLVSEYKNGIPLTEDSAIKPTFGGKSGYGVKLTMKLD